MIKLVLFTNRRSHMGFRLVSTSVTLNNLERRNGRYLAILHWMRVTFKASYVKLIKATM